LSTIAFLGLCSAASAFGTPPPTFAAHRSGIVVASRQHFTALFVAPETFRRAVECAENLGVCDIDELVKLADELEKTQECVFEEGEELCGKEIQDRLDVAEMLRMQGELLKRKDSLDNSNLFAIDVHRDEKIQEREAYKKKYLNE